MDNGFASASAAEGAKPAPLPVSKNEHIEGYGAITVVRNFLPGKDRLLLDFAADQPLPQVTLNGSIETGSTAVMGNGHLMVMLRNVTGVLVSDIELRSVGDPREWGTELVGPVQEVEIVESFDPEEDEIEVVYDPDGAAEIDTVDFSDGTGVTIFFNGKPIMAVRGAQGLRPDEVVLVPRQKT